MMNQYLWYYSLEEITAQPHTLERMFHKSMGVYFTFLQQKEPIDNICKRGGPFLKELEMWLDDPFCHIQSWSVNFFPQPVYSDGKKFDSWVFQCSILLRLTLFAEACRSFLFLPAYSSHLCSSLLAGRRLVISYYNQQETVQIGVLFFLFLRWIYKNSDLKSRHPAGLGK